MEAQTLTLSSRAKPRDLLCALTSNKGPTSELASLNKRSVRPKQFTQRAVAKQRWPLFGVKAHSRSLGFARDDKGEGGDFYWELSDRMDREPPQVPPLRFAPVGVANSLKSIKSQPLGMTKWGFALLCNVVADGWVEPPQKLIWTRPARNETSRAPIQRTESGYGAPRRQVMPR
jgi:hypothetical protein